MADAKAAGKDPNKNFPMHTYTLAFVSGDGRVGRAMVSAGALLVGRLGDSQWLVILDAPDRERARGPARPRPKRTRRGRPVAARLGVGLVADADRDAK